MRDSVLIVGSGQMGCGIATCAALAGNKAILVDLDLERAQKALPRVQANLDELCANELCTKEEADAAMKLVTPSGDMAEACKSARMVIEAVFENLEIKQDMFAKLDELLPVEVPILSNTSGLRITDIAAKVKHPERTLTTHFWLPAHLVPLVEVVIGDHSDPDLAVTVRDELSTWGKAPVIVKKDLPGQLANRILQAIIREATSIVSLGLATPEDVDTSIKMGMALRFPAWGPLEHIDNVGLDLCTNVQRTVLPGICNDTEPAPVMVKCVEEGNLGSKTGKGIYDWTVRSMDEQIAKRNAFIIHALKKIREFEKQDKEKNK